MTRPLTFLLVAHLGLFATACGDSEDTAATTSAGVANVCQQAITKAQGCGVPDAFIAQLDVNAACGTPLMICNANCINAGACPDLQAAAGGTDNSVTMCSDACDMPSTTAAGMGGMGTGGNGM